MEYLLKHLIKIVTFTSIIGVFSCSKPQIENACENISVDDLVDSIQVLIPNAFTPNWDGVNDRFVPVFISNKAVFLNSSDYPTITYFQIKEWSSGELLYQEENRSIVNINGWDGKSNGSVCSGYYKYSIGILTADGTSKTYDGEICSIPDLNKCYSNSDKCVLESQYYGISSLLNLSGC